MDSFTPSGIVSLLTDFGLQDTYVGQMKGVILDIDPTLRIVDLSHGVSSQDVDEGAFQLSCGIGAFGAGTVHVAVVDPGVGTERRAIVVEALGQLWVGPDNGLLSAVLPDATAAYVIENPEMIRPAPSPTFHGRDLFSPVGAMLASGQHRPAEVGSPLRVEDLLRLPVSVSVVDDAVLGRIVSVDRFGNCITLITALDIPDEHRIGQIDCGDFRVERVDRTFADVPRGSPVAYFGSSNVLEMAIREGSAAERYGISRGDRVQITLIRQAT